MMDESQKKASKSQFCFVFSRWWIAVATFTATITLCRSSDVSTTFNPPTTTSASPNTIATSAGSTITPQPFDYAPFLKGIKGWLQDEDLEYELDYYNDKEKSLIQELDFDPEKTVRRLIDSAAVQNTTPEQFVADIQDLMYLQNRSKTDSNENLNEGSKSFRESWKTELKRLEKKYHVSSDCNDPETPVTAARVNFMFPHFLNLGQKPFEVQDKVCDNSYYNSLCVPAFFQRSEFGGLIPREGTMNETARSAVFTLHLYFLEKNQDEKDTVPFRTKCVLVKRRMDKSLVSDERRRRFLENNDVIIADGGLTSNIERAYSEISTDFKEKVFLSRPRIIDAYWPLGNAYVPQRRSPSLVA